MKSFMGQLSVNQGGVAMLVVGLTGGIGSGKSQVSRWFAEHGIVIIDADALVVIQAGRTAHWPWDCLH